MFPLPTLSCQILECVWNVMAHVQKPDFVFCRNGQVHLNRRGCQFSQLLAAEVCASAVVMLDTPCSKVVWEYWLPVAYRGGWFGGFKPPAKFRRYQWNPRSHEQEEPVSPFPFVVHCVLIWFNLLNKGFLIQTVLQWRIWFRSSNPPRHPESLAKSNRIANWAENV